MMADEDRERLLAVGQSDQLAAANEEAAWLAFDMNMRNNAKAVRAYFDHLQEQDFTPQEAIYLVGEWQTQMLRNNRPQ